MVRPGSCPAEAGREPKFHMAHIATCYPDGELYVLNASLDYLLSWIAVWSLDDVPVTANLDQPH